MFIYSLCFKACASIYILLWHYMIYQNVMKRSGIVTSPAGILKMQNEKMEFEKQELL